MTAPGTQPGFHGPVGPSAYVAGGPAGPMAVPDMKRPRPAVVTAAAVVMVSMAAAGLVNGVVGLAAIGGVVDRFRASGERISARQADIDLLAAVAWGTVIVAAVLAVALAALLGGLASGIARGANGARIAAWFVSLFGLMCGGFALLAVFGQAVLTWNVSDDPVVVELHQALTDAYPTWWFVMSGVFAGGQALGYLVVALLLALPAAHAYFRR